MILVGWTPADKIAQAFRDGLRDAGYLEGRDLVLEWRTAGGDYRRVPSLALELVKRRVDVIVADSTPATHAAKQATSTIPIVMAVAGDPIGSGFAVSLAHPGGNITGLSLMMSDLAGKRLQLLKEMLPGLKRVAIVWDPTVGWHSSAVSDLVTAAHALSLDIKTIRVTRPADFAPAFAAIREAHAEAVYLLENAFFVAARAKLLKLAAEAHLPIIYGERAFVEDGALMSYAANFEDMWRRSASYVDKILKGAGPAELPIEQPTQLVLVINLKTAKALGLVIPETVLQRADEVIQ